ncbi:MAG: cobalamin-binding protein [Cyanobacteria bacterium P01_F01_bin.42]
MALENRTIRVISLIPSATEILHCLGGLDALVGRSHECDFPTVVQSLPICTAPNLDPSGSSAAIHGQVESLLKKALSIYANDEAQIERLQPTHILTQAQCEVCAVSLTQVEAAVRRLGDSTPTLISLQPSTVDEVLTDILRVGEVLELPAQAAVNRLRDRMQVLRKRVTRTGIPVGCIEWTEPLMAAGNWVPELVSMAGGVDLLGASGQHSSWLSWEQLQAANPEVLLVMPCGFDLTATAEAVRSLSQDERWSQLQAVRSQQVFLTDGNQYFNRPGPRLVESLEILIEILQSCESPQYEQRGWLRWSEG